MAHEVVYNTTDAPVIADDEGRVIGGGEWGAVDTTADTVKRALDRGDLVTVEVNDQSHADARAARDRAEELTSRSSKLGNLGKDALVEMATDAGLEIDPDDPPHKPDLVSMLAARDVEIPKRQSAAKSSDSSKE